MFDWIGLNRMSALEALLLDVSRTVQSDALLMINKHIIQVFGTTKMSKPDVVSVLTKILNRYDVVLIQEIRDDTNTAIWQLLNDVNQLSGKYDV